MSPLKLKNGRLHIGKHKIRIYLKDSASQWKVFIKWSLLGLLIIILGIIIFNKKEYFQRTETYSATQSSCPKQPCSPSGQKDVIATTVSPKIQTEIPIVPPKHQQTSHLPLASKQEPSIDTEVQMKSSEYQQASHSSSLSEQEAPLPGKQNPFKDIPPTQAEKNPLVVKNQEPSSSTQETLLLEKFEEVLQAEHVDEAEKHLEELKQMNPHYPNVLFNLIHLKSDILVRLDSLYQTRIEHTLLKHELDKNELDKAKSVVQEWRKFNPDSSIPLEFLKRIESVELLQQCKRPLKTTRLKESTTLECYKKVLRQDPNNGEAKKSIESLYQNKVEQVLKENNLEKAKQIVQEWKKLNSGSSILSKVLKHIEVIDLLQQCKKTLKAGRLLGQQSALECYERVLYQDPNNEEAKIGIDHLYQKQVEQALTKNDLDKAKGLVQEWTKLNPHSSLSSKFLDRIHAFELLSQCKKFLDAGYIVGKKSALECYKKVLRQDPENEESQMGMKAIETALQNQVEEALELAQQTSHKKYLNQARKLLQNLEKIFPNSMALPRLKQHLDEYNRAKPLKEKPILLPEEKKLIPVSPPPPQKSEKPIVLPSRCTEIFVQESLGLQPLTLEQKEFKKVHCNPKLKN